MVTCKENITRIPLQPISQGASYASAWRNVQWCLPLFQAHIAQAMACFIR